MLIVKQVRANVPHHKILRNVLDLRPNQDQHPGEVVNQSNLLGVGSPKAVLNFIVVILRDETLKSTDPDLVNPRLTVIFIAVWRPSHVPRQSEPGSVRTDRLRPGAAGEQ